MALALWDLVTLEVRRGAVKVVRWSCFWDAGYHNVR